MVVSQTGSVQSVISAKCLSGKILQKVISFCLHSQEAIENGLQVDISHDSLHKKVEMWLFR